MAEKMHSAPTILVETVGLYETNCYYVFPRNDGPLFIIDPGAEPEKLYENTKLFPAKEFVILLTHAHVDHISGAGVLAEKLGVSSVYVPPDDQALYTSPENALPPFLPAAEGLPPAVWPPKYMDFTIIRTPGHTPGGVCYYFKSLNALFSGDTLFSGSIGRTDFPGGDYDSIMESIREKLLVLPENLRVFPGHGESTTIGIEKSFNPYLR